VSRGAGRTPFKVGVATRALVPTEPYEWRGDANHALATVIWNPADPSAEHRVLYTHFDREKNRAR
jgi:hypothetical protein